jgi:O-antigen ligase
VGALFFALADQTFIDRQRTIADEDAGTERLQTWAGARKLLNARPFGVGGGGFEYLSPIYIPEVVAAHDGEPRSVHNTYLLLATEWGVQSFVLFVGFVGSTMLILRRIRKRSHGNDEAYYKSVAIQVGLISTLTSGIFSNRLSGESIYWLCALAFALYRVQVRDLSAATAPQPAAAEDAKPSFRPAAMAAG